MCALLLTSMPALDFDDKSNFGNCLSIQYLKILILIDRLI